MFILPIIINFGNSIIFFGIDQFIIYYTLRNIFFFTLSNICLIFPISPIEGRHVHHSNLVLIYFLFNYFINV